MHVMECNKSCAENTPDLLLCRCNKLAGGGLCGHICSFFQPSNKVLGLRGLHETASEQVWARSNTSGRNNRFLCALFAHDCSPTMLTHDVNGEAALQTHSKWLGGRSLPFGNAISDKLY